MSNEIATVNTSINLFDKSQFETAQRVASMFAQSELVPDMYKAQNKGVDANGKPIVDTKAVANCMIALSMATRIQADPLMVMQNMIVIYGRPSWSSKFLIATVNTCGRFKALKYRTGVDGMIGKIDYTDYVWNDGARKKVAVQKTFDGTKIENKYCIAFTTEKDDAIELTGTRIDLKTAIREGWYTKSGSKWQTMPDLMLQYRAASLWVSTYAPEISMGMRTVEENEDVNMVEDADYIEIKDSAPKETPGNKADTGTIDMGQVQDAGKAPDNKPAPDPKPEPKPEAQPKDDAPDWG
jgi:hypothetical protein bfra3_11626|nr:MAG TPA: RecT protein [Caudoviricetes sp.]